VLYVRAMTENNFYQHNGYGEQVADNLANWLGLPHVTALDVAILVPLIPVMVLGIIWWAPWETWVWKNVPKAIIGPYLLYCAFAFWHFHARSWLVVLVATIGIVACVFAVKEIQGRGKRWRRPES
jgi:hypothetical protein